MRTPPPLLLSQLERNLMLRSIVLVTCLLTAGPGVAQTATWTSEATVGVVSNYRYRGYSLSGNDPALQGGLTLSHSSGFYADAYVSTIEEYGVGDDGDGAQVEITGSLGWNGSVTGYHIDASVAVYQYPDGDDVDYYELPVHVSRTFNALTGTVGFAYAPEQEALGDDDNRYGWASLNYAPHDWPVGLNARLGYEDGAYAPGGKTDWEVGVSRDVGPATLGLAWTDSGRTDGAMIASVFIGF